MNTVIELVKTSPGACLMVLIVLLLFVSWFIDRTYTFFVELFWGPLHYVKPSRPKCEHEDNLTKICLRVDGCGTRDHCRQAVENNDY